MAPPATTHREPLRRHPNPNVGRSGETRHRDHVVPPVRTSPIRPLPTLPNHPQRRDYRHVPTPRPLRDWDRSLRGPDRDHARQQWDNQHHGWDRDAPWQRDRNWWRHDRGFRLFFGLRRGFFFIPEYGYIAPPPEYLVHAWSPGDFLPNWFWQYEVANYAAYGLPEPPPGCAWVWVDHDVALIDVSDGYILDIVHNIW